MNPNKSQIQHHSGFFLSVLMEVVHAAASVNSCKRSSTKKLFPYVMVRCPGYKSSNLVISSQPTSVLFQIHIMFTSSKISFVILELLAFIVLELLLSPCHGISLLYLETVVTMVSTSVSLNLL